VSEPAKLDEQGTMISNRTNRLDGGGVALQCKQRLVSSFL
jgi:hypothetical protein